MLKKLSIGHQVRVIAYDHPLYGEFGRVISVHADGKAAIVKPLRFPGRYVAVTIEQVIDARSMLFRDDDLPIANRASHYS